MRVWVSWCITHTNPSEEVGSESAGELETLIEEGRGGVATAGEGEDRRSPFSAGGSVVLRVGV